MRRVLATLLLAIVILVTTASLFTPAVTQANTGAPEPMTVQEAKLHGLSIPPGVNKDLKVQAVVVIRGSTPYAKVLQIYSNLRKHTITILGRKFSIVASTLRRDSKGNYVFKVMGPIGEIVNLLKPYRKVLLGISERPLINFETALLSQTPKSKNYFITDSIKGPDLSRIKPRTNNFFIRYLIGAAYVNAIYGINGSGVKVAVIDTGVDYGNPDLQGALDYYVGPFNGTQIREPLVLDADENLVILFKTFTANTTGYINIGNTTFTDYTPYATDLTAPYKAYYVGNVTSVSGNYKFGVLYEYMAGAGGWVKVGVLLADPTTAGNYTTLYIDADNNSVFNDPVDIKVTYDGNRILAAYLPGHSWPYASFGVAGGFFFDTYWWFSYPAQIFPGWDLKGRYLSIFYDFYGHGTSCAAAIASRGFPEGIAPGAKIVGIKGLWFGDVEVGMLWAAGFNITSDGTLVYTGSPRVDLISNSWGISLFTYDIAGFGYDFESLFEDAITTPGFLDPNYPGVLIVHAAGNGGPGYGTITSPGAAAGVLTVGASTSTHLYYFLLGFGGYTYDDIVSWAARGPTPAGYVKPDVVNVGAWGLTAAPVWLNGGNYTIFGGTSYATPLTAGVAALVIQALKSQGMTNAPPWLIKQIIMNTAENLHYPPFDEGAGRVNALAAVQLALAIASGSTNAYKGLRIYSDSFYKYAAYKMARMWGWMWTDYCNLYMYYWYGFTLPPIQPYALLSTFAQGKAYSIYEPDIPKGGLRYFTFTVQNPTNEPAVVQASVVRPVKIAGPVAYYLRLSVPEGSWRTYKYIVIPQSKIPKNTEYLTADVVLPYNVFDGDNDYYADYYVVIIAYVWIDDFNHNGIPDTNERVVINFGYSLSNHNLVQVKLPLQLLQEFGPNAKLLLRVWLARGDDSTPAKPYLRNQLVKVYVTYYGFKQDRWVRILTRFPGRFYVKAGATTAVKGVIRPPVYAAPTAYQDYIKLSVRFADGTTTTYYVPLSYTVYTTLRAGWSRIINVGPGAAQTPYSWSLIKGANAWDWRYEAGDWRVFYVNIPDPKVWMLQVQVNWYNSYTSLITYTLGPDGQFAGTYYGEGASYHYYMGSGRFLWMDTGRYGTANTRSVVTFPLTTYRYGQYPTPKPNVGIYTIIVRTALYGGSYYVEGFRVWVRAIPGYRMLPNAVMPTQGQLTTYVRLPYRASSVQIQPWQAELPELSSQYLCMYQTLSASPYSYSRPTVIFRYTLKWGGLNCQLSFSKPRVDIVVLYHTSIPSLPVYYRYSNTYYKLTDSYTFQDWMITGNIYYEAPSAPT